MTVFRFAKIGGFRALMLAAILVPPFVARAAAPVEDLHQYCRNVGNDDTIREYSHALYHGTVGAFRKLFPSAENAPDDPAFQAQAKFRCMDGKVMACFLGANLVCDKMNAARNNPGADDFCRENPGSDFVPLVATGHDAVYSYRCRNGKAEIAGKVWELDKRGFARKLWTELPDR